MNESSLNAQSNCLDRVVGYADGTASAGCAMGMNSAQDRSPTIRTLVDVAADRNFGDALCALKSGQRITRSGWNGRGMYLSMQHPDRQSKMTRPYIYMLTVDGDLVPWVASQSDLLALDWAILPIQPL